MKLALESYTVCRQCGDREGLRLIREAGFDAVDMSYYWLQEGAPLLGEGYVAYAHALREHLDALGLSCTQAHAPFDLTYGEPFDPANAHYAAILRAIESAAILGARAIVVHSIGRWQDGRFSFDRDYNLAYYRSLRSHAEKHGIHIAVENLFSFDSRRQYHVGTLCTPQALCGFIRELASPTFVACVDVGHAAITGSEPEDFLRGMEGDLLQAVHIQDGDYRGDRHTLPYLGQFDWEAIMGALRARQYTGDLTFEIFGYLSHVPVALYPSALRLAADTGRYLIARLEGAGA